MDALMLGYNENVPSKCDTLLVYSAMQHNYITTYRMYDKGYMLQWTKGTCDLCFVDQDDPSMDVHSKMREGSRKGTVEIREN